MKTVFFIRHAKSSWEFLRLDDFDRPLNSRGKNDAPIMSDKLSDFLSNQNLVIDFVLSSPAKRARETAHFFIERLKIEETKTRWENKLYESSSMQILLLLSSLVDHMSTIILFGHNDEFTVAVNQLSNRAFTENIPTCGIVGLRFEIDSWKEIKEGTADLIYYDYPKKHKKV